MEELRLNIIKLCNDSGLPLEAILFVVKDIYRDVEMTFRNIPKSEITSKQEENE